MGSKVVGSVEHLSIVTWNANGLTNNRLELGIFLEEKGIDIALITETRLSNHRTIGVRGYQVFRKDRDGRGGGVAILVKQGLQAVRVDINSQLEAIAVQVK